MLAPDTYSLVNYREADWVLGEWRDLVARAEQLESRLPYEYRDAFFELVLYPVKASAVVHELYVAVGRNRLHTMQGSVVANDDADRARELFAEDGALAEEYHSLNGGKWNHMMAQINLGYTYWQQPDIETMPAVTYVRARAGASMAVAIEGTETAWPSYDAPAAVLPASMREACARLSRSAGKSSRHRSPPFADNWCECWTSAAPARSSITFQVRQAPVSPVQRL